MIGKGVLPLLGRRLRRLGFSGKVMIVTNCVIAERCHAQLRKIRASLKNHGFSVSVCESLPKGEAAKSCEWLFRIYSSLLKQDFDRSSLLVALGGGVVSDLTGFAAATYKRGIPWAVVPTTLLAQVDASIGGKTAIDLKEGKNLVGAFYQPSLILSDMSFFKTLRDWEFRNGFAEVIKYSVIWNSGLFHFLERNMEEAKRKSDRILERIVYECARIKKIVVERDEKEEKGLRHILNYGHTFAHAIETASKNRIPHGKAVAVGMVAAGRLACRLGLFYKKDQIRQESLIKRAGLPIAIKHGVSIKRVLECMQHDKKKKDGKLRFILPLRIGKVVVRNDISLSLVHNVIRGVL